jgi:hypothetical protein
MVRRLIGLAVMVLTLVAVPAAQADTGSIIEPQHEPPTAADGWQAGNCTTDEPVSGEPKIKCSPETPEVFYKTAAGHPPIGFTQYIIQHLVEVPEVLEPLVDPLEDRDIKALRVDLPPGLTVNPEATVDAEGHPIRCPLAKFLHEPVPGVFIPECDPKTQTGEEQATLVVNENGFEFPPGSGEHPPKGARIPLIPELFRIPVYNLQPKPGEPALFGFVVGKQEPVFLETDVSWESDFHESFTIRLPQSKVPGLSTLISRLVSFGQATGNGTYITNPTTCFDPEEAAFEHLYSTWFRAHSYGEENPTFPNGSTPVEASLPEGVKQEGCENVPFDPSVKVDPGTTLIDSPAPATVNTEMPFEVPSGGEHELEQSHLRKAVVTMPAGMGLNPSGSVGLVACTDAQFHKGDRVNSNSCPAGSEIGAAEIKSPVLSEVLTGKVYVGEQKSTDPTSGEEFRTLVEAKSENLGIVVRLIGNVAANPKTGQLTATFDEQEVGPLAGALPHGLPQAPFESVKLKFDGAHRVLTSPPTCAAAQTTSTMEPWSTPASTKHPSGSFTLSSVPGGGSCPQTLAQRTFLPAYTAKTDNSQGGSYSPLRVHIARPDGQQEIKLVNVTFPKGLTGKLAGIPYCAESAIAAAANRSGRSEQASPSCSSASQIGATTTASGTGANPLRLPGKVYLAGPYKGAPLSVVAITPAVSGPFDLGTVVVRVALNVNRETAQINAVSDVVPDVFGGVKLDIRTIDFNIDRSQFMLNPTNCAAQATTGFLNGGGSDPTNPAAFSSYAVNAPFQATACNKLGFKPKLHTKLFGPVKRAKNPRIRAILEARGGDANISRAALNLPHALFLDQSHIRTVCTRPQLASQTCPKAAVYGQAEARSPLLDDKLKGPVYLVSSNHELPDLVADLRGQVNIQLHGVISSKHGGIKTVFNNLPDVPVKKFILNMQGGKKSLLVNSTNLCKHRQSSVMNLKAQNGKKLVNNKLPLKINSCGGKKK